MVIYSPGGNEACHKVRGFKLPKLRSRWFGLVVLSGVMQNILFRTFIVKSDLMLDYNAPLMNILLGNLGSYLFF